MLGRESITDGIDGAEAAGKRVPFGFRVGHENVVRVRYPVVAFLNRAAHGLLHVLAGTGKARRDQNHAQEKHGNIFHVAVSK